MNSIPLEVLTKALDQIREQRLTKSSVESSESKNLPTNHILDITDQYVRKSLIVTGAALPKREESLSEGVQTAT